MTSITDTITIEDLYRYTKFESGKTILHLESDDGSFDALFERFEEKEAGKVFYYKYNGKVQCYPFPNDKIKNQSYIDFIIRVRTLVELRNRGFQGFLSYTNFENFINIMKTGVQYSRDNNPYKEKFWDSAADAVLENTPDLAKTSVRLYFKENTPTLYHREGIKLDVDNGKYDAHEPIPVCIVYDENIIFEDGVYFANGRPGNHRTTVTDVVEHLKNSHLFNWDAIFSRGTYNTNLASAKATNFRNAEFLYPNQIKTDRIKKIVFRCSADYKRACFYLGKNNLFSIDETKFVIPTHKGVFHDGNRNFLNKYDVLKVRDEYIVTFDFFFSASGMKHEIEIEYNDSSYERIEFDHLETSTPNKFKIQIKFKPKSNNIKIIRYFCNEFESAVWR